MKTLYGILKINKNANQKEIKKAYILMVKKYPPEKSPEMFKEIRRAYDILIDPKSREEYDALLQLIDESEKIDNLIKFTKDTRIIELLRNEIQSKITAKGLFTQKTKNTNEIIDCIKNDYKEFINSIHIIKSDYPFIYNLIYTYYDKVYNSAKYYKKLYNQWYLLRSDPDFPANLIKLITLTLSQNEQDENYLQQLREVQIDIKYENAYEIVYCLNKLKLKYQELYELNQELFERIIDDCNINSNYKSTI